MESRARQPPENFSRLQEEHAKALKGSQETIKKWEQFRYDYEVLQARLHTLPDRLTHDIMVPFGRFGFARGHLYHTNEVTVLLGDNWFAQRTAKQAIEIVERRKMYVCDMLDKERKVMEDLEARTSLVREISAAASQEGFEIREDYDPEEEEQRREAKRRERERRRGGLTVPPPRPAFPKKTAAPGVAEKRVGEKTGVGKEEDLWASLEKREAEEERENGGRSSADAGETGHTHQTVPTITFSHSEKSKPLLPVVDDWGGEREGVKYSTPADIVGSQERGATPTEGEGGGAKSGVRWDPKLVSSDGGEEGQESPAADDPSPQPAAAPFSQWVREKEDLLGPAHQVSSRKISKFKLSRRI